MYRGTKMDMQTALRFAVVDVGALTDELTSSGLGRDTGSVGASGDAIDERYMLETITSDPSYEALQQVRGSAAQAIGLLATYAPASSPALRGEMYALAGYAELLLAELYCSGIPLSTLDFQGDFTYEPGSTTNNVYAHVIVLVDSALAMSSDSSAVMYLASVIKGRALVDLGRYTEAAQAVAGVPDGFHYQLPISWATAAYPFGSPDGRNGLTVATHEGENGIPFSSAEDPRVLVTPAQVTLIDNATSSYVTGDTNHFGVPLFTPAQYPPPGAPAAPVTLASGVEARLIQAEATLRTGDPSWLAILNALRTTCTDVASCPTPAPAGTGGVAGLPPVSDPGASAQDTARVNLLFTERAYWLFLTAHRQGDLRRLVRDVSLGGYGRLPDTVYPTGFYFGGLGYYGDDVNLPIPTSERTNPLFHGCLNRGA
jgi:hypothetical protein